MPGTRFRGIYAHTNPDVDEILPCSTLGFGISQPEGLQIRISLGLRSSNGGSFCFGSRMRSGQKRSPSKMANILSI
jgi:hypothetical protein